MHLQVIVAHNQINKWFVADSEETSTQVAWSWLSLIYVVYFFFDKASIGAHILN
jgi:hypothetical protein